MSRRAPLGAALVLGGLLVLNPPSAPTAPSAAKPAPRVHESVRGDTLSGLAQRYGVSVAAIVAANRLPSEQTTLRRGQRLVIPSSPAPVEKPAARAHGPKGPRGKPPRERTSGPPADFFLAVPEFADSLTRFVWPVSGVVTSPFGRRPLGWHRGIDIQGERGDPVVAAAPGLVVASGVEPRYGRVVKIEHGHGFTTVYAHNDDNLVEIGAWVLSGQRIASIGRTGRATSDHLHFEIRRDGRVYNPLYMLPRPPRVAHVTEMGEDEGHD